MRAQPTIEIASPGADDDSRRMQLLFDATRAMGAPGEPAEVAAKLLEGTLAVLGCARGLVALGDGPGLRRIVRGGELVVARAHIEAMLARRESLLVRDPAAGVRSAMGAPLVGTGGFIYLDDAGRARHFAAEDLEFLNALAHLAGTALGQARDRQRLANVAEALGEDQPLAAIAGASPAMARLRERVRRYAQSPDTAVLILGESGTGKELVARTIHALSPRAAEPFVAVNCAAIPDTLIESELFGHERGAFTGAVKARRGKFALAHGGTLFLDEIGDLSPAAQAKVLRAIEEGEIQPVGAERQVSVDVRVLSATHKRLDAEIPADRFRGDLYYRLSVAELELPPLRARDDDVLLLADRFLKRAAARLGVRVHGFTAAARETLRGYTWPGNVRQLMNEVERALLLADGPDVDVGDLRLRVEGSTLAERMRGLEAAARALAARALSEAAGDADVAASLLGVPAGRLGDPALLLPDRPTPTTIQDAERQLIERALREWGGNIQATARVLGVTRNRLYRKVAKYKIPLAEG